MFASEAMKCRRLYVDMTEPIFERPTELQDPVQAVEGPHKKDYSILGSMLHWGYMRTFENKMATIEIIGSHIRFQCSRFGWWVAKLQATWRLEISRFSGSGD